MTSDRRSKQPKKNTGAEVPNSAVQRWETPIRSASATARGIVRQRVPCPRCPSKLQRTPSTVSGMSHCPTAGSSSISRPSGTRGPHISLSPFAQPPGATLPQPMRSLHQEWAPRHPGLLGDNLDNSLDSGRTGGGSGTASATTANATRLMFNSPGGNCKTCSHSWTGMGQFGTPFANSSSLAKTREERPTGDHVSAVERRQARLTRARNDPGPPQSHAPWRASSKHGTGIL